MWRTEAEQNISSPSCKTAFQGIHSELDGTCQYLESLQHSSLPLFPQSFPQARVYSKPDFCRPSLAPRSQGRRLEISVQYFNFPQK